MSTSDGGWAFGHADSHKRDRHAPPASSRIGWPPSHGSHSTRPVPWVISHRQRLPNRHSLTGLAGLGEEDVGLAVGQRHDHAASELVVGGESLSGFAGPRGSVIEGEDIFNALPALRAREGGR